MADLGRLVVNLEANIAQFTQDMQRASQVTEQTANKISGAVDFAKNALGALGIALSVDLIVSEINRSLDSLAALDDMAQKTGSSVETLSKIGKVADFTGTDLGVVDDMLVKLSKNLNTVDEKGSKAAKALAAIGISADEMKGKDTAEAFVYVTQKLQDYEDGGAKAALITDLISKSAANMLPFMNDVAESVDKFSGYSKMAAGQAAALQDQMGLLKVKYSELRTEIVIAALPAANAFLGALVDTKTKANDLTKNTNISSWADEVAIGLARVADRVKLTVGLFGGLAGSVKVVMADMLTTLSLSPANVAKQLIQGKNPMDELRAMMAEREKILQAANENWQRLLNAPVNAIEERTRKGIAEQREEMGRAAMAAALGINGISAGKDLVYTGSDKPEPKKKEGWSAEGAANRLVTSALDESFAIKNTTEATEDLIRAEQRRMDQYARASAQITANAQQIRMSLMSDAEAEQFEHDARIAELQAYGELALTTTEEINALLEAENRRHADAQAAMQLSAAQNILNIAQSSSSQLYDALKAAGLEQTALGKAMFWAQKAIQIATIIVNTEVAAAAAQAGMIAAAGATAAVSGPAGPGILAAGIAAGAAYATATRAMGYATAGIVAGTAIASAEGGFDIPAGVNPVTQLHEKEMVLPKAQAEVIRGLAANGGAGGGMKVTIVNQTTGRIDNVIEQRISPTERALIIQEAVAATASTLGDPNSKTSRAMSRNFNVARTRS